MGNWIPLVRLDLSTKRVSRRADSKFGVPEDEGKVDCLCSGATRHAGVWGAGVLVRQPPLAV